MTTSRTPLALLLAPRSPARGESEGEETMMTRTNTCFAANAWAVLGPVFLAALGGCSADESRASAASGDGGLAERGSADGAAATASDGGLAGEIPIVAGGSADVPYQFGPNPYGIAGAAFFSKSNNGAATVMLDTTQADKVCVTGTVDIVPIPADGSEPPYSEYWGIEVGFDLHWDADAGDAGETPWIVPPHVVGFWFTVEGTLVPNVRFKTTPTGKDPALEQDSCALVGPASGVPNPVLFTQMYVQCWDGPEGTAPTDITQGLLDVGLQVAADTNASYPVDFCWTHFGVITQ